jgi:hypothetical protein
MTESETPQIHKIFTVRLPQDLYKSLEEESVRTGKPVNDIVVKLLKSHDEAITGDHSHPGQSILGAAGFILDRTGIDGPRHRMTIGRS